MFKPNIKYEILTPSGFQHFDGVNITKRKSAIRLEFSSGLSLECTEEHLILTPSGFIEACNMVVGNTVVGEKQNETIERIEYLNEEQDYYDAINVNNGSQYITNEIVSHNCEFLSSEALLINSLILANMTPRIEKIKPINVTKDVLFWYDIKKEGTYLVGVDPATGSGEDYSAITIYEFPSLRQVAEYRSNTMSTNDLYGVLKNVLIYLEKQGAMVYFSVENNGVGEGVISLYEADEHPPKSCEFVSEDGKDKRGFTTTSRSKMKACVNLKEMIEKNNMEITSPVLLAELKMYVRTKGAYAAQSGGTDDCVSATLIVVRLIEEIATYDQTAFDKLYTGEFEEWSDSEWDGWEQGYDDNDEGLPFSVV